MTTTNATANVTTKGSKMTVFTHDLTAATTVEIKKLNKKLRRQARDEMRAHFDYDAIRAAALAPVAVVDAFDVYDANDGDAEAVHDAFVPMADIAVA